MAGTGAHPLASNGCCASHILQQWSALVDVACVGALDESRSMRTFTGIDLSMEVVPDVFGAPYPADLNGARVTTMEGVALSRAIAVQSLDRTVPIFIEYEGNRMIRDGQ